MAAPVTAFEFGDVDLRDFDEVIDVRTPKEYIEDHIVGAVSLPVLSAEEHARVGTMYKRISAFDARKLGGSLVSANIAKHLNTHFADKPRDYKPLVYCWRGGQRSNSLALVLGQVGWPVGLVQGGYKAYRSVVRQRLETLPELFTYRIVTGLTGSGKSQLLRAMQGAGEQVLDLELLAHHQGSLLGQIPDKPVQTQRGFESGVFNALSGFDPARPVWVEGESGKIGKVFIPQPLFSLLKASKTYRLETDRALRVENTIRLYPHWSNDKAQLIDLLSRLRARHGGQEIDLWTQLIEQELWTELVERLLVVHYDPSYSSPDHQLYQAPEMEFHLTGLESSHFEELALEICRVTA